MQNRKEKSVLHQHINLIFRVFHWRCGLYFQMPEASLNIVQMLQFSLRFSLLFLLNKSQCQNILVSRRLPQVTKNVLRIRKIWSDFQAVLDDMDWRIVDG